MQENKRAFAELEDWLCGRVQAVKSSGEADNQQHAYDACTLLGEAARCCARVLPLRGCQQVEEAVVYPGSSHRVRECCPASHLAEDQ